MLKNNPSLDNSREILDSYFTKKMKITPDLSTRSMNDEIIRDDSCIETINWLYDKENSMQFDTICSKFVVIESNTVPVVVDSELAKAIEHNRGDWKQLQKKCVSIRRERVKEWGLKEISNGLYKWTLRYDSFLGYMRGVLDIERTKNDTLII